MTIQLSRFTIRLPKTYCCCMFSSTQNNTIKLFYHSTSKHRWFLYVSKHKNNTVTLFDHLPSKDDDVCMLSNTKTTQSSFSTIRPPTTNAFVYAFEQHVNTRKPFFSSTSTNHSTSKHLSSVVVRYPLIKSPSLQRGGRQMAEPVRDACIHKYKTRGI